MGQSIIMSRVLIVDDNSDILLVVETVWQMYGLEMMGIEKGEHVLPKATLFLAILILLDVFTYGISGIEFCNILKANHITKNTTYIKLYAHTNLEN